MSSVAERLQRKAKRPAGTKQVRLKLVYIDFWSVVKLSFLIAVALGIITVVATFLIWLILNQTGIFNDLDQLLRDILGDQDFSIQESFSIGQVMLFAIVVAILNVVIGTVMSVGTWYFFYSGLDIPLSPGILDGVL